MEIVRSVADKIREHGEITGAISLANFQKPVEKPAEDARFFEKIGYNKRSNELEQRMREGDIEAGRTHPRSSRTILADLRSRSARAHLKHLTCLMP